MKNRNISLLFCLLLIIFSVSCSNNKKQKVEREEFAFNTIIKMIVYTDNEKAAEKAMQLAFDEMRRIDERYNTKSEGSYFYRLNQSPTKPIEVDEEGLFLINKALELSKLTNGKYDITIAPLLSLWGFSNIETKTIPSKEKLEEILKIINYGDIIIENNLVSLRLSEQQIDTGSFLKGYAISQAKKIMIEEGIASAYISAVSSIETIGVKPNAKWRIGLQNPSNPSELLKIVEMGDKAMGVSGDYQTYVEIDGKRYHHIMNPKTGYPSEKIKMLTVIADNSFLADLYSTAFFGFEAEEIVNIIDEVEGMEALVVDLNDNIFMTSNMNLFLAED